MPSLPSLPRSYSRGAYAITFSFLVNLHFFLLVLTHNTMVSSCWQNISRLQNCCVYNLFISVTNVTFGLRTVHTYITYNTVTPIPMGLIVTYIETKNNMLWQNIVQNIGSSYLYKQSWLIKLNMREPIFVIPKKFAFLYHHYFGTCSI